MTDLDARARTGGARSVFWPADFIRRAPLALRESRRNDYLVLARAAAPEAALRCEHDLAELVRPTANAAAVFASLQSFPVIPVAR